MRFQPALSLIPVIWAGTCLPQLTAQSVTVDKSSLSFFCLVNGTATSQVITLTSGQTSTFVFVSVTDNPNNVTISLSAKGSIPGPTYADSTPTTVTVSVDPTGLAPGLYTASLLINNTLKVPISITVSSVSVFPLSAAWSYTIGGALPLPTSISLNGSAGPFTAAAATSSGGAWFGLNSPNGTVNSLTGTLPTSVTLIPNGTLLPNLTPGTYTGAVTITPGVNSGPPVSVSVTLTVIAAPTISATPSAVSFNIQTPGGTANVNSQAVTVSVTPPQSLTFSLGYDQSWITLPAGSTFQTDPNTGAASVTIGVAIGSLIAGSYTGHITVTSALASTTIKVSLLISSSPLLNVPAGALNFSYPLGGNPSPPQSVTPTATSGILQYTVTDPAKSTWLTISSASGSTPSPFTVAVNTVGLSAPASYNTTLNVTPGAGAANGAQQIQVNLKVTNDPILIPSAPSVSFAYQIARQVPDPVILTLRNSTAAILKYTATAAATSTLCPSGWLTLNGVPNGTANGDTTSANNSFSVAASVGGLAAGTCTGNISVVAVNQDGTPVSNSPISIPVTLVVSNNPLLLVLPSSPQVFTAQQGAPPPVQQTISVLSTSDPETYKVTCQMNNGTGWLSSATTQGATNPGSNSISVAVNSSQLPIGSYSGSVIVTADDSKVANSPLTIPVNLHIVAGAISATPTTLSFTYTPGGPAPATQTVTLGTNSQPLYYTASASSNGNWLTIAPTTGSTNANGTVTVAVDGSHLNPGTFTGAITVAAPLASGSPAVIPVTFTVNPPTISAPTTTLNFTQLAGGAAPPAQTISIASSPGSVPFTVTTAVTENTANWLSVSAASGTAPANLRISANGGSLAPGAYHGTVTVTAPTASGSPINIPVVLNVLAAQSLTVTPTTLNFSYIAGATVPQGQNLTIGASADGTPFTVATQVSAGPAGWLVVAPPGGTSPAIVVASINPAGLTAGTFNGTITIGSSSALAPVSVPVTLTVVVIPPPVVSAIGNAADYVQGVVAPGENIVLFGTGIGPSALAGLQVANGAVTTSIGNTRVLFDGVPAPIIYASANQTSVMVPYAVANRTSTAVQVEYMGVPSTAANYSVVQTQPAIYSLNQTGAGPGATLNQDGITVNSAATPAPRGSVVAVFMTGEGQTTPAGVDGAITPSDGTGLKKPNLAVTATIGGVPASVVYAGSAPGLVSGVLQVNLLIPSTVASGPALPLAITVGAVNSQPGITIAVQ